jgi:TonB family protein
VRYTRWLTSAALLDSWGMRASTQLRFWCCILAGMATLAACRQANKNPPIGQASHGSQFGVGAPRCVYRENGFRSGVNPPREVHREEPDLSDLPPLSGEHLAIIEVRIDAAGRVTESCMLRGVREDVDRRALEAVKAWRFDPPRLRAETGARGSGDRLDAGTAVPIFMTVTMRLGHKRDPYNR